MCPNHNNNIKGKTGADGLCNSLVTTTTITAVEDEDDNELTGLLWGDSNIGVGVGICEEHIPGPPKEVPPFSVANKKSSLFSCHRASKNLSNKSHHSSNTTTASTSLTENEDELDLSSSQQHWVGAGILASREDLALPAHEFAAGCNLLQAAATGNCQACQEVLCQGKTTVDFRDYDRRTALHVAASEGHLDVCRYLIEEKGAKINRSDRWGGSPLDDAHRHRHQDVIDYLRARGATPGSGNRMTNLITAAADGDVDEVCMLLQSNSKARSKDSINAGDYDKRTALHLAAGEGHSEIIRVLCEAGADVNVEDRWKRRPLDDAIVGQHVASVRLLQSYGAKRGDSREAGSSSVCMDLVDKSGKRQDDNLKIDFADLEMIERIGAGAFGEIYKCRWRGTLVAAKIIKSAKIRCDWVQKQMMRAIQDGTKDVDDAVKEMDDAGDECSPKDRDMALADFRQEISVLKSLRHPHIVLLIGYSTTADHEVMISELMKCSLFDVFKAHRVQGTRMEKRTQIVYATQLAQGMNYLHSCKPPIVHRDLKPSNLLIDHAGVLKISDFGLSKVRPDPNKKETDDFHMTGATGSYRFMAPEVFRHEEYNETVDVYSYAMILLYLLVGRPPWPSLSGVNAVRKAAEEGNRPNLPRNLDQRMQNFLKECWEENPAARPPFSQIVSFLARYSYQVFHQDSDCLMASERPKMAEQGCSCVLL